MYQHAIETGFSVFRKFGNRFSDRYLSKIIVIFIACWSIFAEIFNRL